MQPRTRRQAFATSPSQEKPPEIASALAASQGVRSNNAEERETDHAAVRASSDKLRQQPCDQYEKASLWLPAVPLLAGLTCWAGLQEVHAAPLEEPFKLANIHFETNASACDMGVQIFFDTEGITEGSVEDPNDNVVYSFRSLAGMADIGGLTEKFLEGVEPPISELLADLDLDCDPPDDPGAVISLAEIFAAWPAGRYEFDGRGGGVTFEGTAVLTHKIPAGPEIIAPAEGAIVPPDQPLLIRWEKVTGPIIPGIGLGPIEIIGYHVVVVDASGSTLPGPLPRQLDADVAKNETSVTVPKQYLLPNRVYEFEVLATEKSGNQTISEGLFCTTPRTAADCELP